MQGVQITRVRFGYRAFRKVDLSLYALKWLYYTRYTYMMHHYTASLLRGVARRMSSTLKRCYFKTKDTEY